ncbi:MAG TPA: phosphoribosylanthranilate isomerase [Flavitalea sp.]|nr:phosphoribosylanthranilate isomerase [Flavitalea sp.]
MTQMEQVAELADMGVAFAGFIFYPKSPRYVLDRLTPEQIKKEKGINKAGVFVNASLEEILSTVDKCRLHLVQLHGDESPKFCERLADHVSVIKAFRLSDNDSIEWITQPYMEVCDMFMFDTMGAGYGGTGKKFDWNMLRGKTIGKPFFLSGGIQSDDTEQLKEFTKDPVASSLFAVDINSRFELSPGVKDMAKVRAFVKTLNE